MYSKIASAIALIAASACGASTRAAPRPFTERLASAGVSSREPVVDAGAAIQFVNDDQRPHEIYSSDCHELGSTVLAPGQSFVARLDYGPRLCHFQDLLAPAASQYWGTVHVNEPPASAETSGS